METTTNIGLGPVRAFRVLRGLSGLGGPRASWEAFLEKGEYSLSGTRWELGF